MRKTGLVILLALISHAGMALESVREGPAIVLSHDNGIGERIDDLNFTDLDGKPGKLSDYKDKKALVLCITSATCPVARKYGPTLVELERNFAAKGVAFLAVNLSTAESLERIKEAGWNGRYIADREGKIGRALGATSTTEVFVLDRSRTLVYRGAIDDQFGLGYALSQPRQNYLINALTAVLADQRVTIQATTAPGCVLSMGPKTVTATKITYHNRVSRIVQDHCLECHRRGENGPFELNSYEDVKGNAAMIKKVVAKRTMPPWFADPKAAHAFKNDRSLAERDRNDLVQWVEGGCPEGDPADAPVTLQFVEGWRIGKPDLILQAPVPQVIPAKGVLRYRYISVPTNLTEDKWVTAVEVRPSAPEVVHHLLVFIKLPPTDPRANQFKGMNGGLNGYFAGMVPGQGDVSFPEGTAKLLPKGATLVFQVHYTANGKEVQDQPRIGFKFADKPPEHEVLTRAAANRFFLIPPNDPNYPITASHTFFQPVRLLSINPHSHVRGKAFKYELLYPDGRTDVILDLPRYDFNWQLEHQFAKPIDVPAGTRLKVTGWYDNSKENPANPDSSKAVGFGEQTWQEMMIGYFTGYVLK